MVFLPSRLADDLAHRRTLSIRTTSFADRTETDLAGALCVIISFPKIEGDTDAVS